MEHFIISKLVVSMLYYKLKEGLLRDALLLFLCLPSEFYQIIRNLYTYWSFPKKCLIISYMYIL